MSWAYTNSLGVLGGLINGGVYVYIRGGLKSGIGKKFRNEPRKCWSKYVFKLKSHNKATFRPVHCCLSAAGVLYPGWGVGVLITGCIFFSGRRPYNQGDLKVGCLLPGFRYADVAVFAVVRIENSSGTFTRSCRSNKRSFFQLVVMILFEFLCRRPFSSVLLSWARCRYRSITNS